MRDNWSEQIKKFDRWPTSGYRRCWTAGAELMRDFMAKLSFWFYHSNIDDMASIPFFASLQASVVGLGFGFAATGFAMDWKMSAIGILASVGALIYCAWRIRSEFSEWSSTMGEMAKNDKFAFFLPCASGFLFGAISFPIISFVAVFATAAWIGRVTIYVVLCCCIVGLSGWAGTKISRYVLYYGKW